MSGGIPKKVWQGKMQTKTNQTGMKVQGIPSLIGRKYQNKRYIEKRVNSRLVLCGAGNGGWRCRFGVKGASAGSEARRDYCKSVQNGVNGVVCKPPQPITRNLAGGVGHKEDTPRLHQLQNRNNNHIYSCKTCART